MTLWSWLKSNRLIRRDLRRKVKSLSLIKEAQTLCWMIFLPLVVKINRMVLSFQTRGVNRQRGISRGVKCRNRVSPFFLSNSKSKFKCLICINREEAKWCIIKTRHLVVMLLNPIWCNSHSRHITCSQCKICIIQWACHQICKWCTIQCFNKDSNRSHNIHKVPHKTEDPIRASRLIQT